VMLNEEVATNSELYRWTGSGRRTGPGDIAAGNLTARIIHIFSGQPCEYFRLRGGSAWPPVFLATSPKPLALGALMTHNWPLFAVQQTAAGGRAAVARILGTDVVCDLTVDREAVVDKQFVAWLDGGERMDDVRQTKHERMPDL